MADAKEKRLVLCSRAWKRFRAISALVSASAGGRIKGDILICRRADLLVCVARVHWKGIIVVELVVDEFDSTPVHIPVQIVQENGKSMVRKSLLPPPQYAPPSSSRRRISMPSNTQAEAHTACHKNIKLFICHIDPYRAISSQNVPIAEVEIAITLTILFQPKLCAQA